MNIPETPEEAISHFRNLMYGSLIAAVEGEDVPDAAKTSYDYALFIAEEALKFIIKKDLRSIVPQLLIDDFLAYYLRLCDKSDKLPNCELLSHFESDFLSDTNLQFPVFHRLMISQTLMREEDPGVAIYYRITAGWFAQGLLRIIKWSVPQSEIETKGIIHIVSIYVYGYYDEHVNQIDRGLLEYFGNYNDLIKLRPGDQDIFSVQSSKNTIPNTE